MAWPKGRKRERKMPGSGRKPGSKNKDTETIRIAVMRSFEAVGGWKYLEEMARAQPTAYMTLLGKILPHELSSAGSLRHEVVLRWMTPEMAAARGFIETPAEEEETPRAGHGTGSGLD